MKLYGKELDDELAKRKRAREERRNSKIGMRQAAKDMGVSVTEFLAIERGENICSHEEWKDNADFHFRFIFKTCKKCGKVDEKSSEKITDANMDRAYKIFKDLKEKEDLGKKDIKE